MMSDHFELVYYHRKKIYICINQTRGLVCGIQKAPPGKVNPIAIWIERITATGRITSIDHDQLGDPVLRLDALGLYKLCLFVDHFGPLRTRSNFRAFGREVESYFDGLIMFDEVAKGMIRAINDLPAVGEQTYFKRRAMEGHPIEMGALLRLAQYRRNAAAYRAERR